MLWSKYRSELDLHTAVGDAMIACREAVRDLGWRILEQSETCLVCKEVTPCVTSLTWAAQVEIILTGGSADITKVTLNGSIFGFGPIQSGHLRGQVGSLRNRIELASSKSNILQTLRGEKVDMPDVAEQIRKLAQLRDDGILTEEEFESKKAELLKRI